MHRQTHANYFQCLNENTHKVASHKLPSNLLMQQIQRVMFDCDKKNSTIT
ncbi:hypothetical protein MNB_SUP05-10-949 [hydrothermal vent metagenome]|uniref:Uncharacterized protein n=1 Tax=hydrothermal vent metagenome TaxID=652676 RepID=A0A1W1D6E6_9ZZZZ